MEGDCIRKDRTPLLLDLSGRRYRRCHINHLRVPQLVKKGHMAMYPPTLSTYLLGPLTGILKESTETWFSMESSEGRRLPEEE